MQATLPEVTSAALLAYPVRASATSVTGPPRRTTLVFLARLNRRSGSGAYNSDPTVEGDLRGRKEKQVLVQPNVAPRVAVGPSPQSFTEECDPGVRRSMLLHRYWFGGLCLLLTLMRLIWSNVCNCFRYQLLV